MLLQIGGAGGQLPQWATSLIIFGSCVLVTTLVLVAGRLVHHFADRHAGDSPLLLLLLLLLLLIFCQVVLLIMPNHATQALLRLQHLNVAGLYTQQCLGCMVWGQPAAVNETLSKLVVCKVVNINFTADGRQYLEHLFTA